LGSPITGTSANVSGRPDPESLEEVKEQLGGRLGFIVGCGPAPAGTASTIVDITSGAPKLLRTGAISLESIRAVME
jgi:L-threonylcarbamoyladenylate synthase